MRKITSGNLKAFSLIELSLVLLIISAALVGTLKTTSLIKKSRLAAAQSMTRKSPVHGMDDLVAWFETSLDTSFLPDESIEETLISTWFDNNSQASPSNNATQSIELSKPRFYRNLFNGGIPGIRFDGSEDALFFNADALINNGYTIFVVEKRLSNKADNYFLGGNSASSDSNLTLGYQSETTLTFDQNSSSISFSVGAFGDSTTRIHTFNFSPLAGKRYWLNGGVSVDASNSSQTTPLSAFSNAAIGRSVTSYYYGEIAEIIVFSRSLQTEEKQKIENYLSKKFSIELQ